MVAGFVGMMAWYFLIKWTGYEIGYAAWGVGALTGIGARVAGCKGSPYLGAFAAVCALVAILGGQFLAAKNMSNEILGKLSEAAFKSRVAFAKSMIDAPTDQDRKALLSRNESAGGPDALQITDERWARFQATEMPELRDLAAGKITEEQFRKKLLSNTLADDYELLKASASWFTLIWLLLGVGSAFKIASGESD
jgi:hypothetical protein